MQIHELNNFTGTPTSSDYLAIDNSTTTTKIGATGLGVQDKLTVAEANTGTSTASRIVTPKVVHDYVTQDSTHVASATISAWATKTGNDGSIDDMADYLSDCTYIVESGTSGIWSYFKYSDKTYHAWYEGSVSIEAGAAWGSGFYYHAASVVTAPTFSSSITSFTAAPIAGQFNLYCGCGQPDTSSRKPYLVNASSSSASNVTVRYDMYGTWS